MFSAGFFQPATVQLVLQYFLEGCLQWSGHGPGWFLPTGEDVVGGVGCQCRDVLHEVGKLDVFVAVLVNILW